MDEKSHLLEQAERCRRVAEKIKEPSAAAALRTLAEEYERKAASTGEPSHHDATIEDADESLPQQQATRTRLPFSASSSRRASN